MVQQWDEIKQNCSTDKRGDNRMQKYEILSAIGEGAYGVVLKCRDIEQGQLVAIKKFKDSDEEEQTRKTTMREVRILKLATHPNIVSMKEAFRKKGIVYLVFEYVENNLLEVLEQSSGGLKPALIRRLMFQLLKGLAYLHGLNVVHRDIKPQNLLVSSEGLLKVCDFGFARQLKEKQEDITDYVATRWYRPPQLLVGATYGKEIDLWAVACIMCELIDGNPLFPGQNELDQLFLIQKTLGGLPPDLHQRFLKNPRFLGMRLPQIQTLDKLDKKYFGKVCPKGLSLIKSLLKLDPHQRICAEQALAHPYFDHERDSDTRKEVCTAATTRKRDQGSKYGKIYNRRAKHFQVVTQVYQSSNNCKAPNSKSLNKVARKLHTQDLSLQKHRNRDLLMKTEARGFYLDADQKLPQTKSGCSDYKDLTKRTPQDQLSTPKTVGTHSKDEQSPSKTNTAKRISEEQVLPTVGLEDAFKKNKRKPQVIIQKQTFNIKQIINNHC